MKSPDRTPQARPFRMVVALDDTEMADSVVQHALDGANRHDRVELHLLRVVDTSPGITHRRHQGTVDAAHDEIAQLLRERLEDFGTVPDGKLSVAIHARSGRAAEEIVELADDIEADIIYMGRHGGLAVRPSEHGSVVTQVMRDAHCSVMVVQPTGYAQHRDAISCPACVQVRHDSNGERWFCSEHSGDRLFKSTQLISAGFIPLYTGMNVH